MKYSVGKFDGFGNWGSLADTNDFRMACEIAVRVRGCVADPDGKIIYDARKGTVAMIEGA